MKTVKMSLQYLSSTVIGCHTKLAYLGIWGSEGVGVGGDGGLGWWVWTFPIFWIMLLLQKCHTVLQYCWCPDSLPSVARSPETIALTLDERTHVLHISCRNDKKDRPMSLRMSATEKASLVLPTFPDGNNVICHIDHVLKTYWHIVLKLGGLFEEPFGWWLTSIEGWFRVASR